MERKLYKRVHKLQRRSENLASIARGKPGLVQKILLHLSRREGKKAKSLAAPYIDEVLKSRRI